MYELGPVADVDKICLGQQRDLGGGSHGRLLLWRSVTENIIIGTLYNSDCIITEQLVFTNYLENNVIIL